MQKKWVLLGSILLGIFSLAQAQVSVLTVTEEDKHSKKEDFTHTFEYYIQPADKGAGSSKCQATRIGRRWFATAAHCVKTQCENGCEIHMDLLEQPVSAQASVVHTLKKPAVFVHPHYSKDKMVKNDFALIRLDLDHAPEIFYRRATAQNPHNIAMSRASFVSFLNRNRTANSQYHHLFSPQFPAIIVFDNGNYVIDRKLSVISIFGGEREVKPNPYKVHYVKELGFAYTSNFGIRRGMSGSGVMTNTGELIGIISANLSSAWSQGDKVQKREYFMFPVFNQEITSFMADTMGSDYSKLHFKDAYPDFVFKSRQNYTSVINAVRWADKGHTVK